jgi:hypothetical protein
MGDVYIQMILIFTGDVHHLAKGPASTDAQQNNIFKLQ